MPRRISYRLPRLSTVAVAAVLTAAAVFASDAAAKSKYRPASRAVTANLSVNAKLEATVTLTNRTNTTLRLLSHVATHERHYDWYRVELTYPAGKSKQRTRILRFIDDRDKSAPVRVDVAPGKSIVHRIDLGAWAKRPINGRRAIAPGFSHVRVIYDSRRETNAWAGFATSAVAAVP